MSALGRISQRGFSLIELLVSMAIALVVTLAITTVMIQGEGTKRSTTSVNEINQTGAYVAYVLDRQLRSAGSGYAQRWADGFGCLVNAARSGTTVLPRSTAIASPFAAAPLTLRLAPVIIQADAADSGGEVRGDLVTILTGTAGFSESPPLVNTSSVTGTSTSGALTLPNSLGFRSGDLLLLADATVAGGCMVEPVSAAASGAVTLSGTYYQQTGSGVTITSFGGSTYAIQLGTLPSNPPQFMIYGVGDNRTLFSYDLLNTTATDPPPVPIADGVVEMRALYGLDTTNPPDGTVDTWVLPSATGYDATTLTDGSSASRLKLRQIVAVRIGFILRTSLKEKSRTDDPVRGYDAPATITLFGDLDTSVRRTRTVGTGESNYRYRTVEVTVPLRNVLMAPQSP